MKSSLTSPYRAWLRLLLLKWMLLNATGDPLEDSLKDSLEDSLEGSLEYSLEGHPKCGPE